jgi:tetratricopeptide (TPR) repeat protein
MNLILKTGLWAFSGLLALYAPCAQAAAKDAQQKFMKGNDAYLKRNYRKAVHYYNRAIIADPTREEFYQNRGCAFIHRQNLELATLDFSKAVELNPKYAQAYYGLGTIYVLRKDKDQALNFFTKAIELKPDYGRPYESRGNILAEKKNYPQAILDFNKAIELNAGDLDLTYRGLGLCYAAAGDYVQAADVFEKWTQLDPKNEEAKSLLKDAQGKIKK